MQSLSQALTSRQGEDPNPAVLEAFQSAKYSLTTAITSIDGKGALPEKDVIAPNQRSWPETSKRMGAKKVPRRRPDERGLTERSIGAVKGKRKRLHNDPYAGGERSGKRAKRDALSQASQAANAHAPAPSPLSAPPAPSPDAPPAPPPLPLHVPYPFTLPPHVPSAFFPTFANGP